MPFEQFTAKFAKTYTNSTVAAFRAGVYADNIAKIQAHNADAKAHGYYQSINQVFFFPCCVLCFIGKQSKLMLEL